MRDLDPNYVKKLYEASNIHGGLTEILCNLFRDFVKETGLTPTHLIIGVYEKHLLARSPEYQNMKKLKIETIDIFYGCKIIIDETTRDFTFAYTLGGV